MEKPLKMCQPCSIGRKPIERGTMMRVNIFVIVTVFVLLAVIPDSVAEEFLDLYLGQTNTNDAEAWAYYGKRNQSDSEEIDFDPSGLYGLRGGVWSDSTRQIGWAIDVFYFEADSEKVDVSVIPLSVLLMLRLPLFVRDEFPGGKLQPYFGLGPSACFFDIDVEFQPIISSTISHHSVELGWQCQTGLLWQFHKEYGFFVEYRYTSFKINEKWKEEQTYFLYKTSHTEKVKTTLDTHHFLMGISFRF